MMDHSERSRICVKSLPKYANEERLREFFSRKGEVTDAKVIRTSDGKSRQFAFVGFRTENEAHAAISYFNNTYMDTCKIICEVARKVGDTALPRPWSRHSQKKEIKNNVQFKKDIGDLNSSQATISESKDLSDPKLQDFLHVMQPRSKSKIWENDMTGIEEEVKAEEKKPGKKKSKAREIESSSEITEPSQEEDRGKEKKPKDEAVTDMDYFKSRVKENWSDSESESELESESDKEAKSKLGSEPESESEKESGKELELESESDLKHTERDGGQKSGSDLEDPSDDNRKLVLDTGRLFVRNLPYTTTEDELRELFSQHGDVSQVHVVVDRDSKRSKGIGYVLFASPESAVRALEELDNSIFQGRLLHVMAAKPQKNDKAEVDDALGGEKKSLKKMREEKRKDAEASGDTRAWNSLYMRPDTVVENIARKHGISKSELLDREADDLAVRIALGETQIIAEMKRSLSNLGVNVAALEELAAKKSESTKRSNHIILVKNLPYSCSEGDLFAMFGKFGILEKIILPPTRALAVVIYIEPAEARSAFKGLAYKRYRDAPLYLEWAPENILLETTVTVTQEETNDLSAVGEKSTKKVLLDQSLGVVDEEEIDLDRVESRSLYVKDLNFRTTEELLKQHFSNNIKSGTIRSVKIKKHLKNDKNVSKGFGFIEFDSLETATNVLKELQGTVLDGHALMLQPCHAKKEAAVPKKEGKEYSSTKLIVRNVAFVASAGDIEQLFSPFGQIKRVGLPKSNGTRRGFAFVDYITKQEAQNAMQSLSNTHLYGRHLVIERAKEGESLVELRERTAAQFVDESSGFKSLSRKRKQVGLVDEGNVKPTVIMYDINPPSRTLLGGYIDLADNHLVEGVSGDILLIDGDREETEHTVYKLSNDGEPEWV
ncbi:multiple RNA-binding domain-containing protein 1 [Carex littledalei]|uniref:Multiple RNA-binding domain-containing protein 1 n=1 Tax=Carex littledalei TaxID=544730 RepID=A0A833R0H4_9POAL|nr:multiple RNA-binding domain-containing protein 1 [Carex littledalei]